MALVQMSITGVNYRGVDLHRNAFGTGTAGVVSSVDFATKVQHAMPTRCTSICVLRPWILYLLWSLLTDRITIHQEVFPR